MKAPVALNRLLETISSVRLLDQQTNHLTMLSPPSVKICFTISRDDDPRYVSIWKNTDSCHYAFGNKYIAMGNESVEVIDPTVAANAIYDYLSAEIASSS